MVAISDGARLVGYARVSTQDQNLSLQIDALLRAEVNKDFIFTDSLDAYTLNSTVNNNGFYPSATTDIYGTYTLLP